MQEELQAVSALLKVLSNPHRLAVLCELEQGEQSVGTLCDKLYAIGMSGLSQHLTLMKAHGIIASQKRGQAVYYHIADARILELMQTLRRLYCKH